MTKSSGQPYRTSKRPHPVVGAEGPRKVQSHRNDWSAPDLGMTTSIGQPRVRPIGDNKGGSFSQPASCYASTGFLKEQIGALLQPSDNRLATKLFGNSRALTKEKLRQKATARWIVHPCSNFR